MIIDSFPPTARAVFAGAFISCLLACGGDSTAPQASQLPIVYAYGTGGTTAPRNLYLTSVDGKRTLPLPDLGGDEAYPAWRPGSREMIATQAINGTTTLLRVSEAGENIGTVAGVNSIARWSPDGQWIVFANTGSTLLEVMKIDETSRRWISSVAGEVRMAHPSWGPSGEVLFEFGNDGGPNGISTHFVDSPGGGNLTSGPYDEWPAWSPDGKTVAFSMGMRNAQDVLFFEIGLVNADGSNKRQLTIYGAGIARAPTWSPDGKWILYERWDPAMTTCSFVRIPVTGGSPVTVVPEVPGGACGGASWR